MNVLTKFRFKKKQSSFVTICPDVNEHIDYISNNVVKVGFECGYVRPKAC